MNETRNDWAGYDGCYSRRFYWMVELLDFEAKRVKLPCIFDIIHSYRYPQENEDTKPKNLLLEDIQLADEELVQIIGWVGPKNITLKLLNGCGELLELWFINEASPVVIKESSLTFQYKSVEVIDYY